MVESPPEPWPALLDRLEADPKGHAVALMHYLQQIADREPDDPAHSSGFRQAAGALSRATVMGQAGHFGRLMTRLHDIASLVVAQRGEAMVDLPGNSLAVLGLVTIARIGGYPGWEDLAPPICERLARHGLDESETGGAIALALMAHGRDPGPLPAPRTDGPWQELRQMAQGDPDGWTGFLGHFPARLSAGVVDWTALLWAGWLAHVAQGDCPPQDLPDRIRSDARAL